VRHGPKGGKRARLERVTRNAESSGLEIGRGESNCLCSCGPEAFGKGNCRGLGVVKDKGVYASLLCVGLLAETSEYRETFLRKMRKSPNAGTNKKWGVPFR